MNDTLVQLCKDGKTSDAQQLFAKSESLDINMAEDYIFRLSCYHGHLETAKWLYCLSKIPPHTKIDINVRNGFSFVYACRNGHLEVAKWLYQLSKNDGNEKVSSKAIDYAFRWSCINGHLEISKWLYDISKSDGNQKIDINVNTNSVFKWSCIHGRLEVAKWLFSLSKQDGNAVIKTNTWGDPIFVMTCIRNHRDVAKWLSMIDTRYIVTERDTKVEFKVGSYKTSIKAAVDSGNIDYINMLFMDVPLKDSDCELCPVCLSDDSDKWVRLGMKSPHTVCFECYGEIKTCPFGCKGCMLRDPVFFKTNGCDE
jgi:hypothetical protein